MSEVEESEVSDVEEQISADRVCRRECVSDVEKRLHCLTGKSKCEVECVSDTEENKECVTHEEETRHS